MAEAKDRAEWVQTGLLAHVIAATGFHRDKHSTPAKWDKYQNQKRPGVSATPDNIRALKGTL